MGQIVRLRKVAGNLVITIPRAMVRELNLPNRGYVEIWITPSRQLVLTPMEVSNDHPTHHAVRAARQDPAAVPPPA